MSFFLGTNHRVSGYKLFALVLVTLLQFLFLTNQRASFIKTDTSDLIRKLFALAFTQETFVSYDSCWVCVNLRIINFQIISY